MNNKKKTLTADIVQVDYEMHVNNRWQMLS